MTRRWLIALLTTVAVGLVAPHGADARTPCPAEQAAPTALNIAQVNDAILCLSNQVRAHHGLHALRRDARLDVAATRHSVDMATRLFFSHVNPDGLNPGARATAQGYTLGVGENIAYGQANARAVMLGWMGSASHCRNILSAANDLGVGTALIGTPHYTQVFGDYGTRPAAAAPAAGCPYAVNLDALNGAPVVTPPATVAPAPTATATTPADAATSTLSLRALALAPRRFRAGRRTTISYTLSAPAAVTFRVQRKRDGGRFRTVSRRLEDSGVAGTNSLRLSGSGLRAGRYRLVGVAEDAAGAQSRALRATFVVVRR